MLNSPRLDGAEILVVSPSPTWPLDHGNRKRIFSICNALKERGAIIHFLYYPSEGDWRGHYPKNAAQMMQQQWDYYYKVTPSVPLHVQSKGDSHLIDEWWDEAIENEVKWLVARNNFDAIVVNYSWLSKALTFAPRGCLRVLDTHDRFSGRGALLEANGIQKEFFHTSPKEEFKALERADIVWAIKHEEEEFFSELLEMFEHEEEVKPRSFLMMPDPEEESDTYDYENTVVKTMLHVEDKDGFEFQAPYKTNHYLTVGIVGAYNNINLVNTKAFLDVALPIFEKYMVPVKILLAGSMCKGLQDIKHPFVKQLGRVESLDDFYAQLDIALVPMTFSTGLKIKVGEALAYGVPIIAHKHAYEGYPISHSCQEMESLEDIAMAVADAAQNYQEVETLREASEKSQQALHNEVTETLDHLVDTLKENFETALVILPELYAGDYSLQKLRIESVIKNLGDKYRIILYYPFEITQDVQIFLEGKSDLEMVACKDDTVRSDQLWAGVDLSTVHQIWQFKIMWNLSGQHINKKEFDRDFFYFHDNSFNTSTQKAVDNDCNVLVQSTMADRFNDTHFLNWYNCPLSGRIEDIYEGLWQDLPAEESQTVYMLMSGTKEQIHFWYKIYNMIFSDRYKLCWIIDSQEVDWHIENRLDPLEISKDYLMLQDAARCGIMVNIGSSNLISTIAWTLFICKRRIYDVEEISNDKGLLKLSAVYSEMISSVEKLDLNNYNNRFQHNASTMVTFDQIFGQLRHKKVSLCLR